MGGSPAEGVAEGPPIMDGQFAELFLTPSEKQNFSVWRLSSVQDKSIIDRFLDPVWTRLSLRIPDRIAPNVITLTGMIAIIQNWYFVLNYAEIFPSFCSHYTCGTIVFFWLCQGLDSKHAKRLMNDTPLGEFFKYVCNSISLVYLVSTVCLLFARNDMEVQWLAVHTVQLMSIHKHWSAFAREGPIRYWFFGPGEIVTLTIYVLFLRATLGLDWFIEKFLTAHAICHDFVLRFLGLTTFLEQHFSFTSLTPSTTVAGEGLTLFSAYTAFTSSRSADSSTSRIPAESPVQLTKDLIVSLYVIVFSFLSLSLLMQSRRTGHHFTRGALFFMLTYRMVPTFLRLCLSTMIGGKDALATLAASAAAAATGGVVGGASGGDAAASGAAGILGAGASATRDSFQFHLNSILLHLQNLPAAELNPDSVILDGLFMAMITADLVLAKMAQREVHTWVILMCFSQSLPYTQFITVCLLVFYYVAVLGDLCHSLNLPLLQTVKNVYCDGVFDLCHVGHKNLFQKALKYGNRLFVGVCGDADCAEYKRPPIMTHAERCNEVQNCKAVTKVIPNAPTFGLTSAFLKKHRIHIVCCGEEYFKRYPDPKNDPYYRLPREMGIARPMSRYEFLSTSELIERIQAAPDAHERNDGGGALQQLAKAGQLGRDGSHAVLSEAAPASSLAVPGSANSNISPATTPLLGSNRQPLAELSKAQEKMDGLRAPPAELANPQCSGSATGGKPDRKSETTECDSADEEQSVTPRRLMMNEAEGDDLSLLGSCFLLRDAAENLVSYKYHAGAYSQLDLLLNPFWLWCASLFPRWFSPNLVTLTGFLVQLASFLNLLMHLARHGFAFGTDPTPLYFCAFSTWFYQTMDAVDGKHARNTKQSTPLGALWDHGCDAIICTILIIEGLLCILALAGPPGTPSYDVIKALAVIHTVFVNGSFWACQWEHYHTGILPTFGVTESQYLGLSMFLLFSVPAFQAWAKAPAPAIVQENIGFLDTNLSVITLLGAIPGVIVSSTSLLRVIRFWRRHQATSEEGAEAKQDSASPWIQSSGSPLKTLISPGVHIAQTLLLLSVPEIYEHHFIKWFAITGTMWVYLSLRAIVCGLCAMEYRSFFNTAKPFTMACVWVRWIAPPEFDRGVILWVMLIYCIGIVIWFCADVVSTLCKELRIPLLRPLKEPWNICASPKRSGGGPGSPSGTTGAAEAKKDK